MAAEAGISRKQLRHRDVVRLSRDTYLPRAVLHELPVRIAAVLMTAPPGAIVSHLTAAALWGLAIPLQGADDRVHLTVSTGSAVRTRADRAIHRSPWVATEVVERLGLLMTTPARTWRDLAAILPPPALLAVTDQLLAFLCAVDDLQAQLSEPVRRAGGRHGGERSCRSPTSARSPRWSPSCGGCSTPLACRVRSCST
jgi:hypothetical protein